MEWMSKQEWDLQVSWTQHKESQLLRYGPEYLWPESERELRRTQIEKEDKEFGETYAGTSTES